MMMVENTIKIQKGEAKLALKNQDKMKNTLFDNKFKKSWSFNDLNDLVDAFQTFLFEFVYFLS